MEADTKSRLERLPKAAESLLTALWEEPPDLLLEVLGAPSLRRLQGGFAAVLQPPQVALRCSLHLHCFLDEVEPWR